jgi:hypothetical protein
MHASTTQFIRTHLCKTSQQHPSTNSPAKYLSITQIPAIHISTTQSIWHLYNTTQNTPLYKCSAIYTSTTQLSKTRRHNTAEEYPATRTRPSNKHTAADPNNASIYSKAQKQNKQSQPSKRKAKRGPKTQLS